MIFVGATTYNARNIRMQNLIEKVGNKFRGAAMLFTRINENKMKYKLHFLDYKQ